MAGKQGMQGGNLVKMMKNNKRIVYFVLCDIM